MSLKRRQSHATRKLSELYGPYSADGPALLAAAVEERDRLRAAPPADPVGARAFAADEDAFVCAQLHGWFTARKVHPEAIGWLVDCAIYGKLLPCVLDLAVQVDLELHSLDMLGRYHVAFGATEKPTAIRSALERTGVDLWPTSIASGEGSSRCSFTRRLVELLASPDDLPRRADGRIDRDALFGRIRDDVAREARESAGPGWRDGPEAGCDDHDHRVAEFILATFDEGRRDDRAARFV